MKLVWVVGRQFGGGYKLGELYLCFTAEPSAFELEAAAQSVVADWCHRNAVALVQKEVAK